MLGTATLSVAKILENMEIGHNVLHGQWDWMNDPVINSSAWDWDTASTAEAWKHSHNYVHHTYTNIRGKDRDLGYEIMRIDPHQPWHPVYLFQPLYNLALMAFFEWGVAFHDLDVDAIRSGEKSKAELWKELKGIGRKARQQIQKDYVSWPALSAGVTTAVRYGIARARGEEKDFDARAVAQARLPRHGHRRRRGQHHPQRLVARDHLLRALPRPDVHVLRGGDAGRDPGRASTSASCSGRRTSRAGRCCT